MNECGPKTCTKAKRRGYATVVGAAALGAALIAAADARADLIAFTDRSLFETQITDLGGTATNENFNTFTADTSFVGTALDIGDFSLLASDNVINGLNFIDVVPFDALGRDIDGTPYVLGEVGIGFNPPQTVTITFDAPIFAFGLDYSSLGDEDPVEGFEILGQSFFVPETLNGPLFFGVVGTMGETFTDIDVVGNDGAFGLDDFAYAFSETTSVPEPATLAIFGAGLAGLLGLSRFRLARRRSRTA